MKNLFNFFFVIILIPLLFPIIFFVSLIIFFYDFNNPLYVSIRVGKNFKNFKFYKFRSMKVNADKNMVFSTTSGDSRITPVGHFLRKYKIDELPQIINILNNSMSFVGPRANVEYEVKKYSEDEKKLLNVKPGITDLASIVFSNEGEILKNSSDPNKDYETLIRPWKSKLGLIYIKYQNIFLDIYIIFLTALSLFNRKYALNLISRWLEKKKEDNLLIEKVRHNV